MKSILFSIIVPIYNAQMQLSRCLKSIQDQTYDNFECLLVDDGSTDSSGDICTQIVSKDKRFQYFYKENGGVSTARNLGLDHAKGEWICFIDADDYVDDGFLMGFHILSHRGDLLCQGTIWGSPEEGWEQESALNAQFETKETMAVPLLEMYNRNLYPYLMFKAFRRDIIERNHLKFDIALKRRQDEMFINRYVTSIDSINISSECHYHYFFTTSQRMKSMSEIYKKLDFNLDSLTYYCLSQFCHNSSDFTMLTKVVGTRVLGRIFSSFNQTNEFRKKKEELFIIKYILPYKKHIALKNSLRWRILSPFCIKNYYLMRLWLKLYIATM